MEVSLEKIIQLITAEVVKELNKQGVNIVSASGSIKNFSDVNNLRTNAEEVDMSRYKTPILTENHIKKLHELTGEVIVPEGVKITPKAKELIAEKQLRITIKQTI